MKSDVKDHKSCGPEGCGSCPSLCTKTGIAKLWVIGVVICAGVAVITAMFMPSAKVAEIPTIPNAGNMQNIAWTNQMQPMQSRQGVYQCQVCAWQTMGSTNQRHFCPRCGPEMTRIR